MQLSPTEISYKLSVERRKEGLVSINFIFLSELLKFINFSYLCTPFEKIFNPVDGIHHKLKNINGSKIKVIASGTQKTSNVRCSRS